jgi:hypothetical protein
VSVLDSLQAAIDKAGEPKPERPPIIPARWRIPFFVGLAVVSVALLALLVHYVVVPAVRSSVPQTAPAPAAAQKP